MPTISEGLKEVAESWKGQIRAKLQDIAGIDGDAGRAAPGDEEYRKWNVDPKIRKLRDEIDNRLRAIANVEKNNRLLIAENAQPIAPVPNDLLYQCLSEQRIDVLPIKKQQSPIDSFELPQTWPAYYEEPGQVSTEVST